MKQKGGTKEKAQEREKHDRKKGRKRKRLDVSYLLVL